MCNYNCSWDNAASVHTPPNLIYHRRHGYTVTWFDLELLTKSTLEMPIKKHTHTHTRSAASQSAASISRGLLVIRLKLISCSGHFRLTSCPLIAANYVSEAFLDTLCIHFTLHWHFSKINSSKLFCPNLLFFMFVCVQQ